MLRYAARRVLASLAVLVVASALAFVLVDRMADPTEELRLRQPPVPEQTIQDLRRDLYLDRPLVERYWLWLTGFGDTHGDIGLLRGRWGPSARGLDIGGEIGGRALTTTRLVSAALVVAFALAIATGTAAAARRGTRLDRAISTGAALGIAVPTFWLASLLKEGGVWINERLGRRLLFTVGATSPGYDGLSFLARIADIAGHLVLPSVALLVGAHAVLSRHHRTAMLEVLGSNHVRLARAKGLPAGRLLWRHELRNALIPATTVASLLAAGALTGAVIIERTFRWRGLGTFLLDAVGAADQFAVLAFLVVSTVVVVGAGLLADIAGALLDPRIRHG